MPAINDPGLIRTACLMLPLLGLGTICLSADKEARTKQIVLVALGWLVPSLFLVNEMAVYWGFWKFEAKGGILFNTPVDLVIGWAALWTIPALLPKVPLWFILSLCLLFDLALMPLCQPVLILGEFWLVGEAIAIVFSLLPTIYLSRWITFDKHLKWRAVGYGAIFGALFYGLTPSAILYLTEGDWRPFLSSSFLSQLLRVFFLLSLLIGISGVMEFCQRGRGTPLPYDPPQRLVTSGLYAYVANPMQLSSVSYLFLGPLLDNYWICLGTISAWSWSMGVAALDEDGDMISRFEPSWRHYRTKVKNWIPNWRPVGTSGIEEKVKTPIIYISARCEKCQAIRNWIEKRHPIALTIEAAETHPERDLDRITYDPAEGSREDVGVAAVMRALEHIDFRYALLSAFVRTPGIIHLIQLAVDAFGGAPRPTHRSPLRP